MGRTKRTHGDGHKKSEKFEMRGIPIQLWTVNDLNFLKDLINSSIQSVVTDVSRNFFQMRLDSKDV